MTRVLKAGGASFHDVAETLRVGNLTGRGRLELELARRDLQAARKRIAVLEEELARQGASGEGPHGEEWDDLVEFAWANNARLRDRERDFVRDLRNQYRMPSERQMAWLRSIVARLRGGGR